MAIKLALPQLELIDEDEANQLASENALTGATILGQPNGWVVVIHCGSVGWAIAATSTNEPRRWIGLDDAATYVIETLGLTEFRVDMAEKGRDAITRRIVGKAERDLRMRQAAGYQALRMRYYPYRDSQ